MPDPFDIRHMRHALCLAEAGLGHTWPNPSVGALVVTNGEVIAAGVTARGGRPHAETQALAQAGERAKGATLYVTLEPCSHHGQTPPCADTIVAAGIKRVVAACADPNPVVAGRGFARLRAASIEITEGVCEAEANALNEGFFSVMQRRRPFVALKLATSLDGKITTGDADNKWITGEESRREVHAMRARYDALITGIGTVINDDPQLTCRLPGREADSPQRVVLDSGLRISPGAKVLPAWIFTSAAALKREQEKISRLKEKGASFFAVDCVADKLSLQGTLERLAREGITRLFVEAGAALAGAFMREGLVDRLYWFRAPVTVGGKEMPALEKQDILAPETFAHMHLKETQRFGGDLLEVYDNHTISKPHDH